jgi:hypothetical protein
MRIEPGTINPPDARTVRLDGVNFLLTEVLPRLRQLRFFEELQSFSAASIRRLGAVLATKAAIMPVRLLYVLDPANEAQLFVGIESAIAGCARRYAAHDFWPLVESAVSWRNKFPEADAELERVAEQLKRFAPALYLRCVREHQRFAVSAGMPAAARTLAEWATRLE